MSTPIYTRITAYKGQLVILHEQHASNDIVTSPMDSDSMGFVIENTAYIGVSDEAYELLKTIRKSRDSIGDIDFFLTSNGHFAFATMGGPCVLADPKTAEGSRQYRVPDKQQFQRIENEVPQGAMKAIDG